MTGKALIEEAAYQEALKESQKYKRLREELGLF
jgi:hypothetical protein